jgi:hypothetical protein
VCILPNEPSAASRQPSAKTDLSFLNWHLASGVWRLAAYLRSCSNSERSSARPALAISISFGMSP